MLPAQCGEERSSVSAEYTTQGLTNSGVRCVALCRTAIVNSEARIQKKNQIYAQPCKTWVAVEVNLNCIHLGTSTYSA